MLYFICLFMRINWISINCRAPLITITFKLFRDFLFTPKIDVYLWFIRPKYRLILPSRLINDQRVYFLKLKFTSYNFQVMHTPYILSSRWYCGQRAAQRDAGSGAQQRESAIQSRLVVHLFLEISIYIADLRNEKILFLLYYRLEYFSDAVLRDLVTYNNPHDVAAIVSSMQGTLATSQQAQLTRVWSKISIHYD